KGLEGSDQSDGIGDEVRCGLGDDDALSEASIRKGRDARDDLGIGRGRRDDFDEVQVPGRVEEMRPEKMTSKRLRSPLRERRDGDSRRVGGHDRRRSAVWLYRV